MHLMKALARGLGKPGAGVIFLRRNLGDGNNYPHLALYYNTALKNLKELRDIFISAAISATYICGVRLWCQPMAYLKFIDGRGVRCSYIAG